MANINGDIRNEKVTITDGTDTKVLKYKKAESYYKKSINLLEEPIFIKYQISNTTTMQVNNNSR